MTPTPVLNQVEQLINQLSYHERLWLLELIARQLRQDPTPETNPVLQRTEEEVAAAERGARAWERASQNQDRISAAAAAAFAEMGITAKPIGAEKLQQMMLDAGVKRENNEFSRGIIEMREE